MPSKSAKQAGFMRAVAHSPKFAKKVGVPVSVGKEFVKEDKETDMKRYMKGGKMPSKPSLPSQASSKAASAMERFAGAGKRPGMMKGGKVKMQVGGPVSGMGGRRPPSSFVGTGRIGSPPMPDSVKANPRAAAAAKFAARNMGRGSDMRKVPTLPARASQRARDLMSSRMPISTPGTPTPIGSAPSAMPAPIDTSDMPTMYIPEMSPGNAMTPPVTTKAPRPSVGTPLPMPTAPSAPDGNLRPTDLSGSGFSMGYKKGGKTKMASGGMTKSRMDGCATRGKTRGRIV